MKPSKNANFNVSLKLILNDKEGRTLVLKTQKKSCLAGFYDLPGGRIKETELTSTFLKIIKREVTEELGKKFFYKIIEKPVAISRQDRISKIDGKRHIIFAVFFEAQSKGGKINLSGEHQSYLWEKLTKSNYKKYFIAGIREGIAQYLTHKL